MLLSKTDLLPYLDEFSPDRAESSLRQLACRAPALRVSAKKGTGMADWLAWLLAERAAYLDGLSHGRLTSPCGAAAQLGAVGRTPDIRFSPLAPAALHP
jgi:hydrogenase nickel incorporation protein HypB